jgi:hypothetical protein
MTIYPKRDNSRNHQLDLFFWSTERELRYTDPATRRIARQFGLDIHHAAMICRLAGLGEQSR